MIWMRCWNWNWWCCPKRFWFWIDLCRWCWWWCLDFLEVVFLQRRHVWKCTLKVLQGRVWIMNCVGNRIEIMLIVFGYRYVTWMLCHWFDRCTMVWNSNAVEWMDWCFWCNIRWIWWYLWWLKRICHIYFVKLEIDWFFGDARWNEWSTKWLELELGRKILDLRWSDGTLDMLHLVFRDLVWTNWKTSWWSKIL